MTIKDSLADRLDKLNAKRVALVAQQTAELADLDNKIAACANLLAKWDTLTIDQALYALTQTGVRLRLDS